MYTKNNNLELKILISIISFFFLLITIPTIIKAFNYGYYFGDLGSYVEKISIISLFNLSPFMPHLGVNVLSDHFNPIIIFLSPFAKLIPPYIVVILGESFFFILSAILFFIFFKTRLSYSFLFFSIIYILFNYATIIAIDWPIHPETFAISTFVLLLLFHLNKNNKLFLLFFIILMIFFKEENSFIGIAAGFYFILKKKYFKGLFLISISSLIGLWILKLRFIIFGGEYHINWLGRSTSNLQDISTLISKVQYFLKADFLTETTFYFIFPLLYIIVTKTSFKNISLEKIKKIDWLFLFMAMPLIASKILINGWNNHRLATISTLFLLFIVSNYKKIKLKKLELIFLILFIFISSYKIYFSSLKYISGTIISYNIDFFKKINSPLFSKLEENELKQFSRTKSIDKAIIHLKKEKPGSVLIHENIHPKFFNYQWKDVYCISRYRGIPNARGKMIKNNAIKPINFNYFLIAKDGGRWNVHSDKINEIINNVRNNKDTEVWIDDEYVFLAKLDYTLPIDKHTIE